MINSAFYGKAVYRRYKRAKAWIAVFSKPTSSTFRDVKAGVIGSGPMVVIGG